MNKSHAAFFGDRERTFALTPPLIAELERLTGQGIGALARKLFAGDFHLQHIAELLRLALIGGGEKPQEAAALVDAYTNEASIAAAYATAVDVLSAAWFGAPEEVSA